METQVFEKVACVTTASDAFSSSSATTFRKYCLKAVPLSRGPWPRKKTLCGMKQPSGVLLVNKLKRLPVSTPCWN